MSRCINIYFKRDSIVLKIKDDATTNEILSELRDKLPDLKEFYKDEKTPILVTGKILKRFEIDSIQKMIQSVIKVRVDFDSPRTLGLHWIKRTFKKDIKISETKFYKGPNNDKLPNMRGKIKDISRQGCTDDIGHWPVDAKEARETGAVYGVRDFEKLNNILTF